MSITGKRIDTLKVVFLVIPFTFDYHYRNKQTNKLSCSSDGVLLSSKINCLPLKDAGCLIMDRDWRAQYEEQLHQNRYSSVNPPACCIRLKAIQFFNYDWVTTPSKQTANCNRGKPSIQRKSENPEKEIKQKQGQWSEQQEEGVHDDDDLVTDASQARRKLKEGNTNVSNIGTGMTLLRLVL